MQTIPRDRRLDSTMALWRDPYEFISKRCRSHDADLFETRLFLRRTICMSGRDAAELFYNPQRFVRRGAAPEPIRATLLGKGGVQGLDDEQHRTRKAMFISLLMDRVRVEALVEEVERVWLDEEAGWSNRSEIVLYDAIQQVLTRSVCHWAGVPLPEPDVKRRTRELTALFDYAMGGPLKHVYSRVSRHHANQWIAGLIRSFRRGVLASPDVSPLGVVARYRDADGTLLTPRQGAVELLNILRPVVAVSVFVVQAAHALHEHPRCDERLAAGEPGYDEAFVHEVRRFYPFFPAVLARVREAFDWRGYPFPKGRRVVLDLYGTNRDPRSWDAPDEFRPERWLPPPVPDPASRCPFRFVPQGGGDHELNHRCPGETIVVAIMRQAARILTTRISYTIPPQDLTLDTSRAPAVPRSRLVIRPLSGKTDHVH